MSRPKNVWQSMLAWRWGTESKGCFGVSRSRRAYICSLRLGAEIDIGKAVCSAKTIPYALSKYRPCSAKVAKWKENHCDWEKIAQKLNLGLSTKKRAKKYFVLQNLFRCMNMIENKSALFWSLTYYQKETVSLFGE